MTDNTKEREISPFTDSVDKIRCPACNYPHEFQELNFEGAVECNGCQYAITLKIQAEPVFNEYRSVPKEDRETHR